MPDAIAASVGSGQVIDALQYDFGSGQVVAVGAAAVSTTPFVTGCTVAVLTSTTNCWYRIGGTAGAHVNGSDYLAANVKWKVKFPAGSTISVIQDAAGGFLAITPAVNPAFGPMPSLIAGATAAYSLRQLDPSYTGTCITVRRASDQTTSNIGFVGGNLDTATLNTFLTATTGFVTTWFDQSGNANNQTSSPAANQPQIVASVAALGGRPGLLYADATPLSLRAAAAGSMNDVFSAGGYSTAVVNYTGGATQKDRIWDKGNITLAFNTPGQSDLIFTQNATVNGSWIAPNLPIGVHTVDLAYSSASLANIPFIYVDGAVQPTIPSQPSGTIASDAAVGLTIGNNTLGGSRGWPGHIAEIIFWRTIFSSDQMRAIHANQKTYWGTP